MGTIFSIVEIAFFVLMLLSVLYIAVYSIASTFRYNLFVSTSKKRQRVLILIPAYKSDDVIERSVDAILAQDYPKEFYTVCVISDKMRADTDDLLREKGIDVLNPVFEESTKAKSLNYAIDHYRAENYSIVAILDSDNTVQPKFLTDINNAFVNHIKAVQAHRVADNLDTDTAVLDAVSEEINNSIFRRGHVTLGIPSALIGSAMAFDYRWFRDNVSKISTAGEDKELEVLLLKHGEFIDYLPDTLVYDRKTRDERAFSGQRRRWLAAQYSLVGTFIKEFPAALVSGNIAYCDKLIQWLILPRIILVGLLSVMLFLSPLIGFGVFLRWASLWLLLLVSLAIAMPDYLVDNRFKKALARVPKICFIMVINLFRLRGVNKKFIHVDHNSKIGE